MNRAIVAATLVALGTGTAFAEAPRNDGGLYVGAGVGQFNVNIDRFNDADTALKRLDDDDRSWKAFVGWRFNPYLAFDLAYIDFGSPEVRTDASGSSGNYGLDLSGVEPSIYASYPFGAFEVFAKLGYYFYDVDLSLNIDDPASSDLHSSTSSESWAYGGGIGVTFFEHLNARLEYERIDADDFAGRNVKDADAIWLTGAWRF